MITPRSVPNQGTAGTLRAGKPGDQDATLIAASTVQNLSAMRRRTPTARAGKSTRARDHRVATRNTEMLLGSGCGDDSARSRGASWAAFRTPCRAHHDSMIPPRCGSWRLIQAREHGLRAAEASGRNTQYARAQRHRRRWAGDMPGSGWRRFGESPAERLSPER